MCSDGAWGLVAGLGADLDTQHLCSPVAWTGRRQLREDYCITAICAHQHLRPFKDGTSREGLPKAGSASPHCPGLCALPSARSRGAEPHALATSLRLGCAWVHRLGAEEPNKSNTSPDLRHGLLLQWGDLGGAGVTPACGCMRLEPRETPPALKRPLPVSNFYVSRHKATMN